MSVLTDKDFQEALPSSLDLFEIPPYQTSVSSYYYDEVRPLSVITDSSPVEFLITNNGSDYLDLKRSRLHVKLKIVHEDGTSLKEQEKIGPVNLLLHSLWGQVAVYLQGQLLSSSNGGYPYKSMMRTMLDYGEDVKRSLLTSQLFYADTGDSTTEYDSGDPYKGGNDGFIMRSVYVAKSKSVTLSGPLLEDIFDLDRFIVNGIDVGIKLFRNNPNFVLMSDESGVGYKIILEDVYMKVCKLRINNALILAHAKQFEKKNALYPYTKSEIRQTSISVSNMSYTLDNLFMDKCPTRLVVGFVSSEAVSGSLTRNPYNFQGANIKSIGLFLDGVSVPGRPLAADDIEAFVNLFSEKWSQNTGNGIDRSQFETGKALFVFNLEPLSINDTYLNLIRSGNLRLEVQFKSALTSTLNMIAFSQYPALVEVDQQRNVYLR